MLQKKLFWIPVDSRAFFMDFSFYEKNPKKKMQKIKRIVSISP